MTVRISHDDFDALAQDAMEAWQNAPYGYAVSRWVVATKDSDRGATLTHLPRWNRVRMRPRLVLYRKGVQAMCDDMPTLRRLVYHLIAHATGRYTGIPECCLNRLAPWPTTVRVCENVPK